MGESLVNTHCYMTGSMVLLFPLGLGAASRGFFLCCSSDVRRRRRKRKRRRRWRSLLCWNTDTVIVRRQQHLESRDANQVSRVLVADNNTASVISRWPKGLGCSSEHFIVQIYITICETYNMMQCNLM